jgi:hypothetical protein
LEERRILISLQETHLERREEKSVELEELCECVAGIEVECTAKAMKLSHSVKEISDALVDLGMFPIWDIHSIRSQLRMS